MNCTTISTPTNKNNIKYELIPVTKASTVHQLAGQKTQMLLAAISALIVSLLLVGISYVLAPSNNETLPMPEPSIEHQIFTALLWMGLAALFAFITVTISLMLSRMLRRYKAKTIS